MGTRPEGTLVDTFTATVAAVGQIQAALVGEFDDPETGDVGRLLAVAEIVGGLEPVLEGDRVVGLRYPGGEPKDRPAPVRRAVPLEGMRPTYVPGHGKVW